jgi:hypothetical protein
VSTGRPTRASVAGRAYLDLQNLARQSGRPTDELHQLYALEGFLARLAASPYADRLVLKGGVLLAVYDARRPTRDVDLHGHHLPGDVDDVLHLIRAVASLPVADGLVFDTTAAIAEIIRHENPYHGVRVTLTGQLATVATHRQVTLRPLNELLQEYARLAQPRWAAWRRRQRLDDRLPEPFDDLLTHVIAFTDPVLGNSVTAGTWQPITRRWTT